MHKFITRLIIIFIPILLLVILINYLFDPAHIFHRKYTEEMVQILKEGKYCTNITNYNERSFQRKFIEHLDSAPNTIVLGASRSMLITSNIINDNNFINNSVSGASIEDYIALYQLYKEENKLPNKIIIDIEFYLFNKNNEQTRWKTLKKYYNLFYNKNESIIDKIKTSTFFQLFSLSYFQKSLSNAIKYSNITKRNKLEATTNKYNYTITKLLDGSIVYGQEYRNADNNEVDKRTNSFLNRKYIYSLGNFKKISDQIFNKLKDLINDAEKNNVKVEFYLCPLHPKVYKRIEMDYPLVLSTENLIRQYSQENNIKIFGSFNPLQINFDESCFYDGMHCKQENIEKILLSK